MTKDTIFINFFYVFIGAGLGGSIRYFCTNLINSNTTNFFLGTVTINVIGCFLAGFALFFAQKHMVSKELILFLTVGLLGGFTTFSAFSSETIMCVQKSQYWYALCNVSASFFGIILGYVGYFVARYLS